MVFDKLAWQREYRKKNKQRIAEQKKIHDKTYYEKNKEILNQKSRDYRLTPAGKKSETISKWKQRGLIHDDYDALYNSYLQATHCDFCKNEFKDSSDRHMDHNHDTGLFRQFLCKACNGFDVWLKR